MLVSSRFLLLLFIFLEQSTTLFLLSFYSRTSLSIFVDSHSVCLIIGLALLPYVFLGFYSTYTERRSASETAIEFALLSF